MKYFEKKSLTMKVSLIVFIVCVMILSVGMPQAAYAKNANVKNPAKAKLSLNTTYNGYDVTGDGKVHFALFGGRKCVLERSLCGA